MVQSGDQVELDVGLVIDERKLTEQLKRVFGNIGELYQRAGGGGAGGGGGANEAGQVPLSKAQQKEMDERGKVRTTALKHLAQQFPGGGLMTGMASAFKSGGMMAGVATGITAAVGILTSIMKSSQVFQTLSGTVFKVLGFMADMFLMPFVPMMMKFVTWMLEHMPQIQAAGQKTVEVLEGIASVIGWGGSQEKSGQARKERGGIGNWIAGEAQETLGGALNPKNWLKTGFYGMTGQYQKMAGFQMGGVVPGGPGEPTPTMLHGGEMVVPQDIAAGAKGMGGRVASWIERFQQKEMGPGGVISKWYDEMFGHSIIPEMWGNIRGLFQGIETEAENTGRQVAGTTGDITDDNKSFWSKLKFWEHIGKGWQVIKDCFNLIKDNIFSFFTFSLDLPNVPKIDWGGLVDKLAAVGDKLAGWSSKVVDFIVPDFRAPKVDISNIWNCINQITGSITGFFTTKIPNFLLDRLGDIGNAVASVGSGIGNIGGIIWDCMKMIGGGIKGFFMETIPNIFISAWEKVSGWVPSIPGAGAAILSALTKLTADIRDKIMSIPNKIGSIVGSLKFWQFGDLNYSYTGGVRKVGGGGGGGFMSSEELNTTMGGGGEGDLTDLNTAIEKVEAFYEARGGSLASVNSLAHNADNRMTATVAQVTKSFENLQVAHNMANNIADLNEGGRGMGTPLGGFQMPSITEHKTGFAQTYYAYDPDDGWAFGRLGNSSQRRSGSGGGNFSNRTVNVSIISNQSVQDIVRDVERLDSISESSFFNSVS